MHLTVVLSQDVLSPRRATFWGMTGATRGRLSVEAATSLIESDSAALRAAAQSDLDARIAACPEWSTTDLLWHIGRVHWFWNTVVSVPLTDQQAVRDYPDIERPADDQLAEFAAAQAAALISTLRSTDPGSPAWTWAPSQQDCAFVIRHQVQEAAVHRWDAQHAIGAAEPIDRLAALDAVEEFLTVSVASTAWPAEGAAPLGVPLVLHATDAGADGTWVVTDAGPGIVTAAAGGPAGETGAVTVTGSASDLLLWLYERVELAADGPDAPEVVARFHALTSTD
jgi:uncharacterized protein (TIGR03083 family)